MERQEAETVSSAKVATRCPGQVFCDHYVPRACPPAGQVALKAIASTPEHAESSRRSSAAQAFLAHNICCAAEMWYRDSIGAIALRQFLAANLQEADQPSLPAGFPFRPLQAAYFSAARAFGHCHHSIITSVSTRLLVSGPCSSILMRKSPSAADLQHAPSRYLGAHSRMLTCSLSANARPLSSPRPGLGAARAARDGDQTSARMSVRPLAVGGYRTLSPRPPPPAGRPAPAGSADRRKPSRRGSRLPRPLTPPGVRFRTTAVHAVRCRRWCSVSRDTSPR